MISHHYNRVLNGPKAEKAFFDFFEVSSANISTRNVMHGAFLGTFRFVGLYKKVLYTTM